MTQTDGYDWSARSACLGEDPELFFPVGERGPAIAQAEAARRVCDRCEVRAQCLSMALEVGAPFGVWGGTTPDERKRIKRRGDVTRTREHALRSRYPVSV